MAMDHSGRRGRLPLAGLGRGHPPGDSRRPWSYRPRMPRRARNRCASSATGCRFPGPSPANCSWKTAGRSALPASCRRTCRWAITISFPISDRRKTRLIVTPGQCLPPSRPQWGWVAQLYAARIAESWGIGDLADLRRLASWAAGQQADLLMLNPLGAAAPTIPQAASPYYPSSRRFRNPIYLRVEEVPGAAAAGPAAGAIGGRGPGPPGRSPHRPRRRLSLEAGGA